MKFLPLLKTCIKALVRNPMRAALTILGIIIGIAAVIAMVEIGQGSTLQIKSTIASMGADTLNIRPGAISKSGVNTGAGGRASLTNADCEAIMKDCPMVLRATPVVRASGQVIYGNKNWSPETVEGGSVEYLKIKSSASPSPTKTWSRPGASASSVRRLPRNFSAMKTRWARISASRTSCSR